MRIAIAILLTTACSTSVTPPISRGDPALARLDFSAAPSGVVRVKCLTSGEEGTGFLHKSGSIVTAEHVVRGCKAEALRLISTASRESTVASILVDPVVDLALVAPARAIFGEPLRISEPVEIHLGRQVATWGFPSGYSGSLGLLSTGYIAGADKVRMEGEQNLSPLRWVVNASFNSGNSGGPLIDIETNEVIGVVVGKLAPLPQEIEAALRALETQTSGMTYHVTLNDGSLTCPKLRSLQQF